MKMNLDRGLLAGIGVIVIGMVALAGYEIWHGQHAKSGIGAPTRSTDQQGNDTAAKDIPETPKLPLMDDDPEYQRMMGSTTEDDVVESLPSYQAAVERRDALIKSKVGQISDISLYQSLYAEASKAAPQVDKKDFYEEAHSIQQRELSSYAAQHTDKYFLIATYVNYYPSQQKALFRMGGLLPYRDTRSFAKANFGAGFPLITEAKSDSDARLPELGESVELNDTRGTLDTDGLLIVSFNPQQMDAAYTAASRGSSPTDGPEILRAVQIAGTRRKTIMIVGKSDVMYIDRVKVREAYLAVGNQLIAKIK